HTLCGRAQFSVKINTETMHLQCRQRAALALHPNNANGVNFSLTFCQEKNQRSKVSFSPYLSAGRARIIVRDMERCIYIFVS
ncbi:hypothetical protein, partial [Komagataeibacter europaeus]|uniref:hypothetical protein n=1 Tax=Komagataeibacter europaeus TaxID=33995 RepID=UPI0019554529